MCGATYGNLHIKYTEIILVCLITLRTRSYSVILNVSTDETIKNWREKHFNQRPCVSLKMRSKAGKELFPP
jgi:hypothetical protein